MIYFDRIITIIRISQLQISKANAVSGHLILKWF